jgi:hypothetical protein
LTNNVKGNSTFYVTKLKEWLVKISNVCFPDLHLLLAKSYNYFIMVIEYSRRVFFAPNTSDQDIVDRAKKVLIYNGINDKDIQINYNTNELEEGDLYISYDPPDLVIRNVYQKKSNGIIKMKSLAMIKL